jgi:outer membrane protein OmpA-like peptidoglycan-associated protein/tetratricopeptide (TPR) repeat protein
MINKLRIITIILFCVCVQTLLAQNVEFKASNFKTDKEGFKSAEAAIKFGDIYFEKGNELFFGVKELGDNYIIARRSYEKAQQFNPNNGLLNFKIGVCYANSSSPSKSFEFFKKSNELDPSCDPFLTYYLGYSAQLQSNFDEAIKLYTKFETEYKKADAFVKFVDQRKKECDIAKKTIQSPLRVWVDNVTVLNTDNDDVAPSVSVDGGEMVFSSKRKNENPADSLGNYDFDIYSSSLTKGVWSSPERLTGVINTKNDDVVNTISYDGNSMLLHRTINNQSDIYESKLNGALWSDPIIMNQNISNAKFNDRFGCYNHDGYKIYFIRDNEDNTNGYQIVYSGMESKLRRDYATATFINALNSKFNEGPVYITIKGDLMYLASQGHGSMGGYDIFYSKFVQGLWTAPVNMGYPINTPYDDFFFAPSVNGKVAYICSNRIDSKGGYDIYKVTYWGPDKSPVVETEDFLISSVLIPVKDNTIESKVEVTKKFLTVFKGNTIDALTSKAVQASIEITDNGTGKIIETFETNSATGKFIITLTSGKNYGIAVKAKGYLFHSENFDIPDGGEDNLVNKTIELKNIAVGNTIALRNIFFDLGKSTLRLESNAELDRLVKLLQDVPSLKIEISGHTDNTGSANTNESLSQQRANEVVNYLKTKGINAARVAAKGYGSKFPIATNNTEEGRQQNRRTEFKITGN